MFLPTSTRLLALGAATSLAGHVWANDSSGISDYAKVCFNETRSCVPFVRKYQLVCGGDFKGDANHAGFDNRAIENKCDGLIDSARPVVEKGQIIAIYLNQLLVSDFVERGEIFGKKRGEIAVVARIAEQDATTDFDFSSAGVNRGRVVYYSEGVQPGQSLNFSQLPIYGPVEYKGKPLLMEFHVMELDIKEKTELSGMLTAVAKLGQKAYPPASPVLKILEQVGGGLLTTNKNDVQFKYHATLLPQAGQSGSPKMGLLEYGNYAFVRMPADNEREDDTSGTHRWNRWWFNQKNGRIYSEKTCSDPITNRTFLTLQLVQAKVEATLDAANTFAKLGEKLTEESKASLSDKLSIIEALKDDVVADKRYHDAKKLIEFAYSVRWPFGIAKDEVALDKMTLEALKRVAQGIVSSIDTNTVKTATAATPAAQGATASSAQVAASATFTEAHAQNLVGAFSRLAPKPYTLQTFNVEDLMGLLSRISDVGQAAKKAEAAVVAADAPQ